MSPRDIHDFWFGSIPMSGETLEQRMKFWFGAASAEKQQRLDALIGARFGHLIEKAARDELASWAATATGRLSLIILLDQFPRNVYRGTARAFAYDGLALELALAGMRSGADGELDMVENIFFYLPLQHAESRHAQRLSVDAYRRLLAEAPQDMRAAFAKSLEYAEDHRAIIERFGRFPHRNKILGRTSTLEELDYLRTADSFGQ